MPKRRKMWWNRKRSLFKNHKHCSLRTSTKGRLFRTFNSSSFNFKGGLCNRHTGYCPYRAPCPGSEQFLWFLKNDLLRFHLIVLAEQRSTGDYETGSNRVSVRPSVRPNVNPRFFLIFLVIVCISLHRFHWDLAHMLALRWRCERRTFWQWRKVRCHGNGPFVHASVYKMLTLGFFSHLLWLSHYAFMDLSETWHTRWPWGKDVRYLLFDSGGKCVAMVTVPLSMLLCTKC